MTYKDIYKIGQTLIQSFNSEKKLKGIKGISEKYRNITPVYKYEEWSIKYFTMYSLYLIQKYAITSFSSFVKYLKNDETKEFQYWKSEIVNYKDYMKKDIEYLKQKYGKLDERALQDFIEGKIKFYTLYFILYYRNKLEELSKSRVYGLVIKKLKFLMNFLKLDGSLVKENLDNF